jgi:hypothetical protein
MIYTLTFSQLSTTVTMGDHLIYIVSALFVLSVITEKLTQLVRSYPFQFKILSVVTVLFTAVALYRSTEFLSGVEIGALIIFILVLLYLFFGKIPGTKNPRTRYFRNIGKTNINKRDQEIEVSLLSFIVALVIAFVFNANMIALFQSKEFGDLGWGERFPVDFENLRLDNAYEFSMVAFIGFLISGFFLTFGSKFFHDLLDLLLESKNLKKNFNAETQENEVKLVRLQMDNKATLLENASPDERARLEAEILALKVRLTRLLNPNV